MMTSIAILAGDGFPRGPSIPMSAGVVVLIVVLLALIVLGLAIRIVKQYEKGVLFRLGRLRGTRGPGLRIVIPLVDVLHRVSLRIVTLPRQLQGEPDVFDQDEAREAAGGCA
jgi:regulator of protease activity HflC (stomatin/prohibitin superfamily)